MSTKTKTLEQIVAGATAGHMNAIRGVSFHHVLNTMRAVCKSEDSRRAFVMAYNKVAPSKGLERKEGE